MPYSIEELATLPILNRNDAGIGACSEFWLNSILTKGTTTVAYSSAASFSGNGGFENTPGSEEWIRSLIMSIYGLILYLHT